MRQSGVIINPCGRLFAIALQSLADKTDRIIDFGWRLIRLKPIPERDPACAEKHPPPDRSN